MNLSRLLFFVTLAVRVSCTSSNLRSSGDADPRSRNTPNFSSSSDTLRSSTPPVLGYHTTGHAKDNTNTNTDANVNASPNSVDVGMHVGGNLNSPSERTLVDFDHIESQDDQRPNSFRSHASSRTLTSSKSKTRDCIEFVKQNKALCAGLAFVGMCGIGFAVTLVVLQNRPHGSNDPTCPAPSGSHGGGCTNTTTMMKKRGVNSREGGEGGGEEGICRLEYNLGDECSCNAATEIVEANPNGEIQSIRRGPGREVKKLVLAKLRRIEVYAIRETGPICVSAIEVREKARYIRERVVARGVVSFELAMEMLTVTTTTTGRRTPG
ncbi:hypothetical protein F5880DRAFT_1612596 [Lentinula raphanica]|nr:hypothetical protein F5880DRAFT_1612596 [Lentinula raphanica]